MRYTIIFLILVLNSSCASPETSFPYVSLPLPPSAISIAEAIIPFCIIAACSYCIEKKTHSPFFGRGVFLGAASLCLLSSIKPTTTTKDNEHTLLPLSVGTTCNLSMMAGSLPADIYDILDMIKHPDTYTRLGAALPRGILLYGRPGTGKKSIVRALAGELNIPFFAISGTELDPHVLNTDTKALIFIDEIESIAHKASEGSDILGHQARLHRFLKYLDTCMQIPGVFIIAATTHPDLLDPLLFKPGRFDRLVEIPLPNKSNRRALITQYAQKITHVFSEQYMTRVLDETQGFSPADLKNVLNEAALLATREGALAVTDNHLESALKKINKNRATSYLIKTASGITTTLRDIAGALPEDIVELAELIKHPEKFNQLGVKIPRGILLYGPSGTGKTSLARAIAGEAGVPFFATSGSQFVTLYVGMGPKRVRELFEQARKTGGRAIIFIDEIDAIGGKRSNESIESGSSREYRNTLNELLNQMDGFTQDSQIIVIAATNTPDILDPALLRPGRFDRLVEIPLPNQASRQSILEFYARKITHKLSPEVFEELAQQTAGLSGAELAYIINEAALLAVRCQSQAVDTVHIWEALKKTQARNKLGLYKKIMFTCTIA